MLVLDLPDCARSKCVCWCDCCWLLIVHFVQVSESSGLAYPRPSADMMDQGLQLLEFLGPLLQHTIEHVCIVSPGGLRTDAYYMFLLCFDCVGVLDICW